MLITLAPWSTAQRIAAARFCAPTLQALAPVAVGNTFTGRIRAFQFMPAMPAPFAVAAAAVPATCVPCPHESSGLLSSFAKSVPGSSRDTRSG
jgi:hypothetical protein